VPIESSQLELQQPDNHPVPIEDWKTFMALKPLSLLHCLDVSVPELIGIASPGISCGGASGNYSRFVLWRG
jgi:hypothetical protein